MKIDVESRLQTIEEKIEELKNKITNAQGKEYSDIVEMLKDAENKVQDIKVKLS